MSSSQEIGSGLISFEMIFEALQSELFRFKFPKLSSNIEKIPEFDLIIALIVALLLWGMKKFPEWTGIISWFNEMSVMARLLIIDVDIVKCKSQK